MDWPQSFRTTISEIRLPLSRKTNARRWGSGRDIYSFWLDGNVCSFAITSRGMYCFFRLCATQFTDLARWHHKLLLAKLAL